MKRLEKDFESTFQRVVKIDPFEVSAYRALASIETFGKYDSFERKWLLLFILNSEIHLIVWIIQFSGNPKRAHELLSKAIELVHDEKELTMGGFVRGRLVATIAMERSVQTNATLGLILQRLS